MARRSDVMDTIVNLAKRRGFVYPVERDLRRAARLLGLRAARRRAEEQRQAPVVEVHGAGPRRRRRPRLVRHPRARGVGGQRPRRGVRRPAHRVPVLPQALPGRPPGRGVRGEARPAAGERPRRHRLPQLRHQGRVHRAARCSTACSRPTSARSRTSRAWPTCAPRPRRASSSTTRTSQQSARRKPPFGIGQIGKSFRNEITPGNFIFRTREFEQMEMEFFVEPGTDEEWHQYWIDERFQWYVDLGITQGEPAALRAPAGEAVALLQADRGHRVPLRLPRQRVGRARGRRQPHRLRPDDALQGVRRRTCRTSTRRPASATSRTSSSRRRASTAAR